MAAVAEEKCLQCGTPFNSTNSRKVTDDCSHVKCRTCLVQSIDGCKLCKTQAESKKKKPFQNHNHVHTCSQNGPTSGSSSTTPVVVQSILPITRRTARLSANRSVASKSTNSVDSPTSPPTLLSEGGTLPKVVGKRISATRDSRNDKEIPPAKISKSGRGSPDITQGVPRESPSRSSRSSLVAKGRSTTTSSSSPPPTAASISSTSEEEAVIKTKEGSNFMPPPPEREGEADDDEDDDGGADPDYAEGEWDDGELDADLDTDADADAPSTSAGGGDGEGGQKKKKKRSPVVIDDHITVLGGDPSMYQCNVCQKKFKTKAHIKYHEFCQKGDKPFKCEQCGQGFISKSHYEYHLRTHTGERPYLCPKCGKGFNQQGKVTRHMRSHTGEKPFICQECNRGFATAQSLRSHVLIHTGERPFVCTYCNKRFTGMSNLKKHVITHTGERLFLCNHCGKSFGLKWTLDIHLRTHSSERPHACDQCSRAFSNSKDLRRHLIIHTGERPFKCWICEMTFCRKDNLDRHIKNTHNQPKEVDKKSANEAATEYLKNNAKSQSQLQNIPTSKVNSVVIANIIKKNNDFLQGDRKLGNSSINSSKKDHQTPSTSAVAIAKDAAAASKKTSKKRPRSSGSATSVQPSTSSSSPNTKRQRMIITAPISPPSIHISSKKKKPVPSTSSASALLSSSSSRKKGKKGKKSKKAARSPSPNIRVEKVVSLPSPSAPIDDSTPIENVEVVRPEVVEKEKKTKKKGRKEPTLVLNEDRRPTLALVTVSSPKQVEREEEDEEEVESILPHDIDEEEMESVVENENEEEETVPQFPSNDDEDDTSVVEVTPPLVGDAEQEGDSTRMVLFTLDPEEFQLDTIVEGDEEVKVTPDALPVAVAAVVVPVSEPEFYTASSSTDNDAAATAEQEAMLASIAAEQEAILASEAAEQEAILASEAAAQEAILASEAAEQEAILASEAAAQEAILASEAAEQEAILASEAAEQEAILASEAAAQEAILASEAADKERRLMLESLSTCPISDDELPEFDDDEDDDEQVDHDEQMETQDTTKIVQIEEKEEDSAAIDTANDLSAPQQPPLSPSCSVMITDAVPTEKAEDVADAYAADDVDQPIPTSSANILSDNQVENDSCNKIGAAPEIEGVEKEAVQNLEEQVQEQIEEPLEEQVEEQVEAIVAEQAEVLVEREPTHPAPSSPSPTPSELGLSFDEPASPPHTAEIDEQQQQQLVTNELLDQVEKEEVTDEFNFDEVPSSPVAPGLEEVEQKVSIDDTVEAELLASPNNTTTTIQSPEAIQRLVEPEEGELVEDEQETAGAVISEAAAPPPPPPTPPSPPKVEENSVVEPVKDHSTSLSPCPISDDEFCFEEDEDEREQVEEAAPVQVQKQVEQEQLLEQNHLTDMHNVDSLQQPMDENLDQDTKVDTEMISVALPPSPPAAAAFPVENGCSSLSSSSFPEVKTEARSMPSSPSHEQNDALLETDSQLEGAVRETVDELEKQVEEEECDREIETIFKADQFETAPEETEGDHHDEQLVEDETGAAVAVSPPPTTTELIEKPQSDCEIDELEEEEKTKDDDEASSLVLVDADGQVVAEPLSLPVLPETEEGELVDEEEEEEKELEEEDKMELARQVDALVETLVEPDHDEQEEVEESRQDLSAQDDDDDNTAPSEKSGPSNNSPRTSPVQIQPEPYNIDSLSPCPISDDELPDDDGEDDDEYYYNQREEVKQPVKSPENKVAEKIEEEKSVVSPHSSENIIAEKVAVASSPLAAADTKQIEVDEDLEEPQTSCEPSAPIVALTSVDNEEEDDDVDVEAEYDSPSSTTCPHVILPEKDVEQMTTADEKEVEESQQEIVNKHEICNSWEARNKLEHFEDHSVFEKEAETDTISHDKDEVVEEAVAMAIASPEKQAIVDEEEEICVDELDEEKIPEMIEKVSSPVAPETDQVEDNEQEQMVATTTTTSSPLDQHHEDDSDHEEGELIDDDEDEEEREMEKQSFSPVEARSEKLISPPAQTKPLEEKEDQNEIEQEEKREVTESPMPMTLEKEEDDDEQIQEPILPTTTTPAAAVATPPEENEQIQESQVAPVVGPLEKEDSQQEEDDEEEDKATSVASPPDMESEEEFEENKENDASISAKDSCDLYGDLLEIKPQEWPITMPKLVSVDSLHKSAPVSITPEETELQSESDESEKDQMEEIEEEDELEEDDDDDRLCIDESYEAPSTVDSLKAPESVQSEVIEPPQTTAVLPEEKEEELVVQDDVEERVTAAVPNRKSPTPPPTELELPPSPESEDDAESTSSRGSSPVEKPETLPPDISDFVLSVMDKNEEDLSSISSESLASPEAEPLGNSVLNAIRTLDDDLDGEDNKAQLQMEKDKEEAAADVQKERERCLPPTTIKKVSSSLHPLNCEGPLQAPALPSKVCLSTTTNSITTNGGLTTAVMSCSESPLKAVTNMIKQIPKSLESSSPSSLSATPPQLPTPKRDASPPLIQATKAPSPPHQSELLRKSYSPPTIVESQLAPVKAPKASPAAASYRQSSELLGISKKGNDTGPTIIPVAAAGPPPPPPPRPRTPPVFIKTRSRIIRPSSPSYHHDTERIVQVPERKSPPMVPEEELPAPSASPPPAKKIKINGSISSSSSSSGLPFPKPTAPSALKKSLDALAQMERVDKRPREEEYKEYPTRVHFLLPSQSVAAISSGEAAASSNAEAEAAAASAAATAQLGYDPSLLYFVRPDGQPAAEGDYQLVYAAAAATAVHEEGIGDEPPKKLVKLLYAEALGVGPSAQNANEVQYYYAAATPDQQVTSGTPQVQLMQPCRVTYTRGTNEAMSEVLQYQIHPQQEHQHQQQQVVSPQQQVLNLSVQNPTYYYSTTTAEGTVTHSIQHPQQPQQQQIYEHQYSINTTQAAAKVLMTNHPLPHHNVPQVVEQNQQQQQHHLSYSGSQQSAQQQQNVYHHHQQQQYHHHHHQSSSSQLYGRDVHDLSSRRLELPVHTARENRISYAHVQGNDPNQYNLMKAREMQHVFPQGALRHCTSNIQDRSDMPGRSNIQSYTNGTNHVGCTTYVEPTNGLRTSSPSSASTHSSSNNATNNMSGVELLLSAASERAKAAESDTGSERSISTMDWLRNAQYDALRQEQAAFAIAQVGEMARQQRKNAVAACRNLDPTITPTSLDDGKPPLKPYYVQRHHPYQSQTASSQIASPRNQQVVQVPSQFHPNSHQHNNNNSLHHHRSHPQGVVAAAPPPEQHAGIRRGPRKYYLSRSFNTQD